MTQRYWPDSLDGDIGQDYLFYTQFNIMLPYVARCFGLEVDDYLEWLGEDFQLDHAKKMAPIFGLSIELRYNDSEELMCWLHASGDPRKTNYDLPIQIHYVPTDIGIAKATEFADDMLHALSHHGDALRDEEWDEMHVYRVLGDRDIVVYYSMYLTLLIIPNEITERLRTHSESLSWPHDWVEQTDPLQSDLPTLWKSYLQRIRQSVSRGTEPTKLAFEVASWCYRQKRS